MLPKRPTTPQERVAVKIEKFALDLPERPVGVWIGDVQVLYKIAVEADRILRRGLVEDETESLCGLIGEYHGQPGHNWAEWQEPYEARFGEWFHYRVCQRCNEHEFERCDALTEQDGAE